MAKSAYVNPFEEDRLNDVNDFRAEWDVPSLNAAASDWLTDRVSKVRDKRGTSADRKIAVLLGPSGLGKTHVFGRVANRLGHQVLFAFVPQILCNSLIRPSATSAGM